MVSRAAEMAGLPLPDRPPAARALAEFATGLRYENVPPEAIAMAKRCLIDAVACAVFGARLPWSAIVARQAMSVAARGPCRLQGALEDGLTLPAAAMCLGVFAHAFELDSLRKPGAGVHPGATVALPALMAAQAAGACGRDLIVAIVAGCEVMFRIGKATLHTPESLGFHAPGITGPFGAATAAGFLLGLDAGQLANAYGIAGSLAAGLLAFARSGDGGMVKRLHLGRAAEGGVTAALLARDGFAAPTSILEGEFGVLDAFCDRYDADLLTRDLGIVYEISTLCIKRYACHVTAQVPVEGLRRLMKDHYFSGADIESVAVVASDKVLSHHADRRPRDIMLAQYSLPFCVAVAAYRDPADPRAFSQDVLSDPAIRSLAERIDLRAGMPKGWGVQLCVRLHDGRIFNEQSDTFLGCPEQPMRDEDVAAKFASLTAQEDGAAMRALLKNLQQLEAITDCSRDFHALHRPAG
jgi:2-methylcitrate dehydratase PrpD